MSALLRLTAVAGLLGALAGCYGVPVTDQPVTAAQNSAPAGIQCYAGFYTCVLPQPGQVGSGCSCPGIGAPSYGVVR